MHTRAWKPALTATLVVLALGACGDEGPNEGAATAEARMTDTPPSQTTEPAYEGPTTTNAMVEISTDGSTWVELGSPNGITMQLQARDSTTVHGEAEVAAGTYTRVRLTLQGAKAKLLAGSRIGTTTLTSDTDIDLGGSDGSIVIEKQVPGFTVTADADTRTVITFDLNSEIWLTAGALTARLVEDATLASAATAAVTTEAR
jgi:hypothetical protein